VAVVRTYMAHHQGMLLVAIANVLHAGAMRARFHAEAIVQATELLLQERNAARRRGRPAARGRGDAVPMCASSFLPSFRRFTSPHGPVRTTSCPTGATR